MQPLTIPFRVLLDPVGTIPAAVAARRWVLPLILVALAVAASGAAVALRLDASRMVIPKMAMTGELMKASEREITEAIEQAQRVALVGGIAKGVFVMPLVVLLIAVALKIVAWLIGKKALFIECITVAAVALVPVAIFHVIVALSALRADALTPKMIETLVPSSLAAFRPSPPPMSRVFTALDAVNVWVSLLLGVGFAAATKWRPWKGALLGLFLYVLFAAAFMIGLPGLAAGGPGGGPGMGGP